MQKIAFKVHPLFQTYVDRQKSYGKEYFKHRNTKKNKLKIIDVAGVFFIRP